MNEIKIEKKKMCFEDYYFSGVIYEFCFFFFYHLSSILSTLRRDLICFELYLEVNGAEPTPVFFSCICTLFLLTFGFKLISFYSFGFFSSNGRYRIWQLK